MIMQPIDAAKRLSELENAMSDVEGYTLDLVALISSMQMQIEDALTWLKTDQTADGALARDRIHMVERLMGFASREAEGLKAACDKVFADG